MRVLALCWVVSVAAMLLSGKSNRIWKAGIASTANTTRVTTAAIAGCRVMRFTQRAAALPCLLRTDAAREARVGDVTARRG